MNENVITLLLMSSDLPQHTDSYQSYHLDLIQQLVQAIKQHPPFDEGSEELRGESEEEFLRQLNLLTDSTTQAEERNQIGQTILLQVVAAYQHLMVIVPRSLFWYFGGDCLHYLGDEELEKFQQLEEAYYDSLNSDQNNADYPKLIALMAGQNTGKPH